MPRHQTTNSLYNSIAYKLKQSGIEKRESNICCLAPLSELSLAAVSLTLKTAFPPLEKSKGVVIPYFDLSGNKLPYCRIRILEQPSSFAQLPKYLSPKNSSLLPYFPPLIDWEEYLSDSTAPVLLTEGEFKSICGTKFVYPTIGLSGVWCFKQTKKNVSFLPQLEAIDWKRRPVTICFDSDVATNEQVQNAEQQLAKELTNAGATVNVCRIPSIENKKTGLDDYIMAKGAPAFKKLLEESYQYSINEVLMELNRRVVYIRDPGLVVDLTTGQKMNTRHFTDSVFANWFFNEVKMFKNGSAHVNHTPAAKAWLEWKHRNELDSFCYTPGLTQVHNKSYNLWTGWGCPAIKGDVRPWIDLMNHLFQPDQKAERRWFEQWCAYPVQYPGTKLLSASVLWGLEKGSGKSTVGYTLMKIYGKNAIELHDNDFSETRNVWLDAKQFVFGDEMTGNDSRKLFNRFQTLITQKTINVNKKYIPEYSIPDYINYYFTAQDPDAFYLNNGDRRFFIHEVLASPMPQPQVDTYQAWLNGEGPSYLRHYFENLDLSGFRPSGPALMTEAKQDMIDLTRSDLARWVQSLAKEGPIYINGDEYKQELWTSAELLMLYDVNKFTTVTQNGLARELRKFGFKKLKQVRPTGHQPVVLYALRNTSKWLSSSYEAARHWVEHTKKKKY